MIYKEGVDVKVVIPARLSSSRLPEKALLTLQGRAIFWHVYQRCIEAGISHDNIYLATDSDRIYQKALDENVPVIMTSDQHMSGTDRVNEVATLRNWSKDTLVINVQGDEPLIPSALIRNLAQFALSNKHYNIFSAYSKINDSADLENKNIVKIAIGKSGNAVYFSRSHIPFNRDNPGDINGCTKHIGIYAYNVGSLNEFCLLPMGHLELLEKLEQLRALENNMTIGMMYFDGLIHHGVDTIDDYNNIKKVLDNECN